MFGIGNNMIFHKSNNSLKIRESEKGDEIESWLKHLASYCDLMPDSNEIHLPHASKKEVFWQFERDRRSNETSNEIEPISYKHFLSICI